MYRILQSPVGYKIGKIRVLTHVLMLSFCLLFCRVVSAGETLAPSEGILFTNVDFTGYSILVDEIILKNVITHEEISLRPYQDRFIRRSNWIEQVGGFVYMKLPAGRYYISQLRLNEMMLFGNDMPKNIFLDRNQDSIHVLAGYITYIGDMTVNIKRKGSFENESNLKISIELKADMDNVKSVINDNMPLFSQEKLVFNVPGNSPVPVDIHR